MTLWRAFALFWLWPVAVWAQDAGPVASSILTLNVDRVFVETEFGQRLRADFREEQEAFAEEQRALAADLRAEELDLAERRPDMDPLEFQREAEAFDENAQAIRRAQDAREDEIEAAFGARRTLFVEVTRPILEDIMRERGATAILDPRAVVLANAQIDITNEAIARINAEIGDGSGTE